MKKVKFKNGSTIEFRKTNKSEELKGLQTNKYIDKQVKKKQLYVSHGTVTHKIEEDCKTCKKVEEEFKKSEFYKSKYPIDKQLEEIFEREKENQKHIEGACFPMDVVKEEIKSLLKQSLKDAKIKGAEEMRNIIIGECGVSFRLKDDYTLLQMLTEGKSEAEIYLRHISKLKEEERLDK